MADKHKALILAETIVIVALIFAAAYLYSSKPVVSDNKQKNLLSPKVCAGLDEPKSYSILDFSPLQRDITQYIHDNRLNVSVYVKNMRNGASMGINPNQGYFPASLNKLPIAILVMQKVENGEFAFDTMLNVTDEDRRNTSGELYKTKSNQLPLKFVLEKLLTDSDNTAFYILLNYVNADELKPLLDYMGVDIYSNYHPKNFVVGSTDDYISPRSMSNIFSSLYFSTVLGPQDSQYILSLLTNTVFDIKKEANLPDDVTVSQKFGEYYKGNAEFFHSCGIMYINTSRIFYCIMTKDLQPMESRKVVGTIVSKTYHYVVGTREKLDLYRVSVENVNPSNSH